MSAQGPADLIVLDRFLIAAHASRVIVAALAVHVAFATADEIPTGAPVGQVLSLIGLAWIVALAALARPLDRLLRRHPSLVFVDTAVLVALMMADKPWDSLVALPYGSFLLAVAYVRPAQLAAAFLATAVLEYAPKLALEAGGWRYADLTPPTGPGEWLTAYVGPLFAGLICWALCVLLSGVRNASDGWQRAQDALTDAHARQADAQTRLNLADRVHETISQSVRSIPLRLDGGPADDLTDEAARLRAEVIRRAMAIRPVTQRISRELREAEAPGDGDPGAG